MFLTPSDFTGKYELHTGMYDQAKLTDYIDRYEIRYLRELFGVQLYNEFINDLDPLNVPQSPNFKALFFPFAEDRTLYEIIQSEGILEMLKGFIYFEYSKDLINQMTPYGNVQQKAENSKVVTTLYSMIYTRYNEAIKTYSAIRDYIFLHPDPSLGQIVNVSITNAGTGYITGSGVVVDNLVIAGAVDVATIQAPGGTGYTTQTNVTTTALGTSIGTGLIVSITADISGTITNVSVVDPGTGYELGDLVQVDAGNNDGQLEVFSLLAPFSNVPGIGSGATVDIVANGINGAGAVNLTTPGTGYTAGTYPTTGGAGTGCTVTITVDNTGAVTLVTVEETGNGYAINDVLTINAGNNDADFEILSLTNGEIIEVTINSQGENFQISDVLTVAGGDENALLEVTYVGVGNMSLFNGKHKLTAYWL